MIANYVLLTIKRAFINTSGVNALMGDVGVVQKAFANTSCESRRVCRYISLKNDTKKRKPHLECLYSYHGCVVLIHTVLKCSGVLVGRKMRLVHFLV